MQHKKRPSTIIYGSLAFACITLFGIGCESKKNTTTAENNAPRSNTVVQQPEEKTESESVKVTAKMLTAAYEANEVSADSKYKGKTLEVSGTVTGISKDVMDDVYITLAGDNDFREVQCFTEDKDIAGQLHKGMKVTFKGECDGLMMNVLIKDCVLVQ